MPTNFIPPQRYGTAFHLRPPVTDVRDLPVPANEPVLDLEAWDELTAEEQSRFLAWNKGSAYYLWHLTHLNQVTTRLIYIPAGQSAELSLSTITPLPIVSEVYWVVVGAGATLTVINDIENQTIGLQHLHVRQRTGSFFSLMGLRAHNAFLHEKIDIYMSGSDAKVTVTHLVVAKNKEQADIEVNVWHQAPRSESTLTMRAVAGDKATVINRGLIDIDVLAKGSIGYQAGRALLASRGAVVDILPRLEIRTNDVRCSHGVTTTYLDDEALFYVRSRGLPKAQAETLAQRGFFHDRLAIPLPLADRLDQVL